MEQTGEYRGEVIHNTLVMGKFCHMFVDDVGDDNVFLGRKIIENSEKICPYGAYTGRGPQGSINIHVALVCLNMAPNRKLFICMHVYAFG